MSGKVMQDSTKQKYASGSAGQDKKRAKGRLKNNNGYYCENQSFASKEAFKRLRTNVLVYFDDDMDAHRLIGVTSSMPAEGKSTVSINFSYSLAEQGKNVLLVDCDMRLPSIHEKLDLNAAPGLSDLLNRTCSVRETLQTYTSKDGSTSFDVMSAGTIPENPSELLGSQTMVQFFNAVTKSYDFVVCDFPPINSVIDAVSTGRHLDGFIVVLREGACQANMLDDCVSQMKFSKIPILGFVVNGAQEGASKKYQYNSKYGYYK